ncbi:hypothetical protein BIY24_05675 [Halobacteriovorax marinus]|uniref:hypothetical protein n=1 Tax=Halobacteriovorax marinus TaxID=97084 RepID=UPI000BC35007|nr:hypothetical protein [Halobacteriovorax marinus]ATH07448.1 hypothetical protein BIY24_05675 [Halobacteriovorax marinus]
MKVFVFILSLTFLPQVFASTTILEGHDKEDSCFLIIENTSKYTTNIAVSENLRAEINPNYSFTTHPSTYREGVIEGRLYTSNLPSESRNLRGWLFGSKPKTYILVVDFDEEGIPVSFVLSSKKENRGEKSLVNCQGLEII